MRRPSQLLLRLNLETRRHHADSDALWLSLLVADIQIHRYAAALIRTYGFEAPLEAAFAYTRGLDGLIDLRERARAGAIAQDLLTIGFKPWDVASLLQCEGIAPFPSTAQALGWMYVVERATLLHDTMRRQLLARLPDIAPAASYLGATSGVATARWLQLGEVLDRVARAPAVEDEIMEAAHEAFAGQQRWFAAHASP
jgi:heme oxygenase (biliverdin-IX-beta and delta-forming)